MYAWSELNLFLIVLLFVYDRHEEKVAKQLKTHAAAVNDALLGAVAKRPVAANIESAGSENNNNTLTADEDQDSSAIFDDQTQFVLSKKKREYLEQKIEDRSGQFDYQADPTAYKKARK